MTLGQIIETLRGNSIMRMRRHRVKETNMRSFRNAAASLRSLAFGASALIGSLLMAVSTHAQAVYYQGKTITIVQGRDPGGTGDMRVRAMLPYLKKHIPGNPSIVVEYMPGGGSRKAANHVYQSAAADGLMIGNLSSGMVSAAVLGVKGVLYDLDKFFYLGSPFSSHVAILLPIRRSIWAPLKSCEQPPAFASAANRSGFRFTTRLVCLATSLVSKHRSL